MLGKTLDAKYRIERLLGSGGMGSVYAADDLRTGQKVAIKVIHANLPDSKALVQRFEREARAAGSIATEHIARCFDAGTDAETGSPYMVLEYLVGEDLHHLIKRLGPLPPDVALRIAAQACLGVAKAHEAGIVHRDIKPANLFLASGASGGEAGARTVKVLDFGVAKIRRDPGDIGGEGTSGGLTRTGSLLGSPLYMSPEQARSVKNLDHRSDIWSLGVVLYQAVAGRTPYEDIGGLGDLILALCSDLPPPVQNFAPWLSPDVAAAIDHALRLDPGERFQSAAEMAAALSALVVGGVGDGGIELRDEMLVSLDDASRRQVAPTYARQGGRSHSGISRPDSPVRVSSPTAFAGTVPSVVPSDPAPAVAIGAAQLSTQNAVATTGSRLPDTGDRHAPSTGSRSLPMLAVALACVVAGGAGVYAFTRPGPSAAGAPLALLGADRDAGGAPALAPTVAPVEAPAVTASAAASPSAAPSATPTTSATTDKPFDDGAASGPKPRAPTEPLPTAGPAASARGQHPRTMPTVAATASAAASHPMPLDHTSFGDRK